MQREPRTTNHETRNPNPETSHLQLETLKHRILKHETRIPQRENMKRKNVIPEIQYPNPSPAGERIAEPGVPREKIHTVEYDEFIKSPLASSNYPRALRGGKIETRPGFPIPEIRETRYPKFKARIPLRQVNGTLDLGSPVNVAAEQRGGARLG
jgi:hypothetical protein